GNGGPRSRFWRAVRLLEPAAKVGLLFAACYLFLRSVDSNVALIERHETWRGARFGAGRHMAWLGFSCVGCLILLRAATGSWLGIRHLSFLRVVLASVFLVGLSYSIQKQA